MLEKEAWFNRKARALRSVERMPMGIMQAALGDCAKEEQVKRKPGPKTGEGQNERRSGSRRLRTPGMRVRFDVFDAWRRTRAMVNEGGSVIVCSASPGSPFEARRRRLCRLMFVLLILLVANIPSRRLVAGESDKVLQAVAVEGAVRVDGRLDDPIWTKAPKAKGFTQQEPNPGHEASFETWVMVAFDAANLYIGARLFDDDPSKIVKRLTRRDRQVESDWFGILIDGYHDHRTARLFNVNASGVQMDATVSGDTNVDSSWDGVWESAVHIDATGWSVEMRIPFSMLRIPRAEHSRWGFNIFRYISRLREKDFWAEVSPDAARFVSAAGHLVGVRTTDAPRGVAVIPYEALSVNVDTTGEEWSREIQQSVGVDAQFDLNPDFTLNLTANPDFGQVEVDQAVLNLSAFETFYPEKRPFFLEGADIFNTVGSYGGSRGARLFYSRRIGGTPLHYWEYEGASTTLANPAFTPILSAARLTGRTEEGLSLGVLGAVTGETHAQVQNEEGGIDDVMTSPLTSYAAGRVRTNIGGGSYIGTIVTAVNRAGRDERDAYVLGADGLARTADGMWSASGVVALSSQVEGSSIRDGLSANFFVSKAKGSIIGTANYGIVTKEFEVNDLGFNNRVNEQGGWAYLQYRDLDGLGPFLQARFGVNNWTKWYLDTGRLSTAGGNINAHLRYRNQWSSMHGLGFDVPTYDAYETRLPGLDYRSPGDIFMWYGVDTDSRKKVLGGFGGFAKRYVDAGWTFSIGPWGRYKPASNVALNLSIDLNLEGNNSSFAGILACDDGQSAADGCIDGARSLFGRRDVRALDLRTRGTLTFSRNLSLQFFGQLLMADGRYADFGFVDGEGIVQAIDDATLSALGFAGADFSYQVFNANIITRWEFRPGSTLYAVWTQSRVLSSADTEDNLFDYIAPTFTMGSENTFVVKASYRFGN